MPKKLTQEEFINSAIEIHGNKYSYHLVNYINTDTHVDIWCNRCQKSFPQTPYKHTKRKQGCRDCQYIALSENFQMSIEDILIRSKNKHGDTLSYEFIDYKNQDSIINLTCKIHNYPFSQTVFSHNKSTYPCPICFHEHQKEKPNVWSHSIWVETGLSSKNFVAFQLYVLKCWNDYEEFYKIGKTFTNIDYRFSGKKMPYNYKVIHLIVDEGLIISKKEHYYQDLHKEFRYTPLIKFNGSTECYSRLLDCI